MERVIVESPYSGDTAQNLKYLAACLRDCILRGESPYASHGLYTMPGCLDDSAPEERALGMKAGLEWYRLASKMVVYADLGISSGMLAGMDWARERGCRIELRSLPEWALHG